ncbi:MAG: prolipoprotein diacylglyceryl transferase [Clostridia bacterium]|nr:prolipoprotein diacylglyceryl transferase [Clostridia bacterium]
MMILLGLIAFTLLTIFILEKKEKVSQKITNRILIVCAVGLVALYLFAFAFNSLFHSIARGKIVLGGITWLGGILGAFPVMIVGIHFFCPRIKGNALFYFNLLIPAIALGHCFGRIGCFCGGCCYGGVTDSFLGVQFPAGSNAALTHPALDGSGKSLPLFPTQLFEAAFELFMFASMMIFYKKLRPHFLKMYCFGYGIFRFGVEFLRGDNRGSTGFALSPSQVMSIVLIIIGVLLILYEKEKIFKKLYAKMKGYREEGNVYGAYLRTDIQTTLKCLKSLQQDGVITETEYAQAENKLNERILIKPTSDVLEE